MADKTIELIPPARRESPIVTFRMQSAAASVNYLIKAGRTLDVPNVWGLINLHLELVASAAVANRYVKLLQYIDCGQEAKDAQGFASAAITASQTSQFDIVQVPIAVKGGSLLRTSVCSLSNEYAVVIQDQDYLKVYVTDNQAGDLINIVGQFKLLNRSLGMPSPYEVLEEWAGKYPATK